MFTGNLLMLLTSDEVWAQEDIVTESDFETDIKGMLHFKFLSLLYYTVSYVLTGRVNWSTQLNSIELSNVQPVQLSFY